ncbi:hypothetical protein AMTR_s00009p00211740 [Amborella trichopoda]|uniref:Uncharacterized protein n=1 Tax=Amborella trichopoda TaxID=13333 RepID=W1NHI2_AMBTC|nr:hypothetical protein AMTR_s00009p00211740 [Amborella trichopoda]
MEDYERPERLIKFIFPGIQNLISISHVPPAQQMEDIIQLLYNTASETSRLPDTRQTCITFSPNIAGSPWISKIPISSEHSHKPVEDNLAQLDLGSRRMNLDAGHALPTSQEGQGRNGLSL